MKVNIEDIKVRGTEFFWNDRHDFSDEEYEGDPELYSYDYLIKYNRDYLLGRFYIYIDEEFYLNEYEYDGDFFKNKIFSECLNIIGLEIGVNCSVFFMGSGTFETDMEIKFDYFDEIDRKSVV